MIDYRNIDCMKLMASMKDKSVDLAIVDPPYFKGPNSRKYYGQKVSPIGVQRNYDILENWDIPQKEYFDELLRVSKNQIIWGCNYFDYHFGPGRIVWDKCNGKSSFSDVEIAYCSMHASTRLFKYMWSGMFQGKSVEEGWIQQGNKKLNEKRIHPTQKPIALYKWLLAKYANEGDIILDTHGGSLSIGIACYDMGFDLMASEIDLNMFKKSKERLDEHTKQISIQL